jgi:hypothetical protein
MKASHKLPSNNSQARLLPRQSASFPGSDEYASSHPALDEPATLAPEASSGSAPAGPSDSTFPVPHGPIQYRFVLKFAPQMSTPCSRGLAIKPRAGRVLVRRAPRMFQSYLQRHSVLG